MRGDLNRLIGRRAQLEATGDGDAGAIFRFLDARLGVLQHQLQCSANTSAQVAERVLHVAAVRLVLAEVRRVALLGLEGLLAGDEALATALGPVTAPSALGRPPLLLRLEVRDRAGDGAASLRHLGRRASSLPL